MHALQQSVRDALSRGFLAGQSLRVEDEKKSLELTALLSEIDRVAQKHTRRPLTLVDACAGKAALSLLSAKLVLKNRGAPSRIVAIERDALRRDQAVRAAEVLEVSDTFAFVVGSVDDLSLWPHAPDVAVALHACARASDMVIDRAMDREARHILIVPCCYGAGPKHDGAAEDVAAQGVADAWQARVPLPRHGLVGKRFAQSIIDAERTLRLESRGWQTEVVELFSPTVSPFNMLWRARFVGEAVRMKDAEAKHRALTEIRAG